MAWAWDWDSLGTWGHEVQQAYQTDPMRRARASFGRWHADRQQDGHLQTAMQVCKSSHPVALGSQGGLAPAVWKQPAVRAGLAAPEKLGVAIERRHGARGGPGQGAGPECASLHLHQFDCPSPQQPCNSIGQVM